MSTSPPSLSATEYIGPIGPELIVTVLSRETTCTMTGYLLTASTGLGAAAVFTETRGDASGEGLSVAATGGCLAHENPARQTIVATVPSIRLLFVRFISAPGE